MSGAKIDTSVETLQKIERGIQPPISVTLAESCRLTGLGLSSIYAAIAAGAVESVSIGKRRLIMFDSLRHWIEAGRSKPADTRPNWVPPSPALRHTKAEAPRRMRRRNAAP